MYNMVMGADGVARPTAVVPNSFPAFMPPVAPPKASETSNGALSFDDAVRAFKDKANLENSHPAAQDVTNMWQAFGSMSSSELSGDSNTPKASQPVHDYSEMFKDFKPTLNEPRLFSDLQALSGAIMGGLPQMDWAATLSNGDTLAANNVINDYIGKAITRAVTASFALLKSAYEESIPEAFKTSFNTYRTYKQKMAGQAVQAPVGMDIVARALTERFIAMRPHATPEEVKQAVGALMGSLNSLLTPKPSDPSQSNNQVDWANFI